MGNRPVHKAALVVFLFFSTHPALADILTFPGQASPIQETIDRTRNGDTGVVAEGRYYENIVIREKAVTLASASKPACDLPTNKSRCRLL